MNCRIGTSWRPSASSARPGTVTGSRFLVAVRLGPRPRRRGPLPGARRSCGSATAPPGPCRPRPSTRSSSPTPTSTTRARFRSSSRRASGARRTARPRRATSPALLLPDSGRLQEEEARYANRKGYSKHAPNAAPLYSEDDAVAALPTALAPRVRRRARDRAGRPPPLPPRRAHPRQRARRARRLGRPRPLRLLFSGRPRPLRRAHPPRSRAGRRRRTRSCSRAPTAASATRTASPAATLADEIRRAVRGGRRDRHTRVRGRAHAGGAVHAARARGEGRDPRAPGLRGLADGGRRDRHLPHAPRGPRRRDDPAPRGREGAAPAGEAHLLPKPGAVEGAQRRARTVRHPLRLRDGDRRPRPPPPRAAAPGSAARPCCSWAFRRRARAAPRCRTARPPFAFTARTSPVKARVASISGFSAHADEDEITRWLATFPAHPRPHVPRPR